MTSNETSFALLKSIIAEDVYAYEVNSTINLSGSQVSDYSGNSRAQKFNWAQTNQVNIAGVEYFYGILSYALISKSGVNFEFIHYLLLDRIISYLLGSVCLRFLSSNLYFDPLYLLIYLKITYH